MNEKHGFTHACPNGHDFTVAWDLGRLSVTEEWLDAERPQRDAWCIRCGALWTFGHIVIPDAVEEI